MIDGYFFIPASSDPWSDTLATTNKVHYAGNTTNGANYTWYTATASTQGSSYSICPRGWKIPSIYQYETMMKAASISFKDCKSGCTGSSSASDSSKIRGKPYNFPYTGYVNNGSLSLVGPHGYYWSSMGYDNNNAYNLFFISGSVTTGAGYRFFGYSIRCIAP